MKPEGYRWLPDEEYATLVGHVKYNISLILYGLHLDEQGHQDEVKLAIPAILEQVEKFGMALRGKPEPIQLPPDLQCRFENARPDD